ncbi:hypothetical protein P167DRAFT_355884 [Morchella conica CCBAS932]|uniref:Uncharacterized protein n=1 Tax=Morchella conica CCBAS932 TaxID=1392247 RepID=A0A3N4KD12_9PEZI|nr:hypothetical protein P167DRAFT_355884 [Morchella conica CCBAS932]
MTRFPMDNQRIAILCISSQKKKKRVFHPQVYPPPVSASKHDIPAASIVPNSKVFLKRRNSVIQSIGE